MTGCPRNIIPSDYPSLVRQSAAGNRPSSAPTTASPAEPAQLTHPAERPSPSSRRLDCRDEGKRLCAAWSDPLVARGLTVGVRRHADQYHFEPAPSTETRAINGAAPAVHRVTVATAFFRTATSPKNHRSDGIGLLRAMTAQQRVMTQPVDWLSPKHHPFGLSLSSPAKCGREPAIIGTDHSQSG